MKTIKHFFVLAMLICFASTTQAQVKVKPAKQQFTKMGCATIEPFQQVFAFDTVNARSMADNYYLWDNGKVLKVKIMSGSPKYKEMIKKYAKEWEKYANIKFEFVETGDSHIRVILTGNDGGGNYSKLGTMANMVPQDEHTLHLDTTSFTTAQYTYTAIVHEFGHAIGLMHEHMNPTSGIKWDKNRVYAAYKMQQGWSKEQVDAQLFKKYSITYTNGTKYDAKSIMHYPISRWETLDGFFVDWNYSISEGDKQIVSALYPKKGNRINEVPRFAINGFSSMTVERNDTKQGVSFYPSFNITTAGKAGRVYYLAVFTDENGNNFETTSSEYKVFGVSGTSKSAVLNPGLNMNINKGKKDLELFIPYSEIPESIRNKNIRASFYVFLFDNDEMKLLYASKSVPCNMAR
jgi:serralysin